MNLKEFINLSRLQDIQDQFSNATGLAAIAVDTEGNYITKGSNFTDFCMKYTRGTKEGSRRCVKCDNECSGTYFCHAGLMDFSADLVINGEKIGAIIGGQVLPTEPVLDDFRAIARELGINEDAYIAALQKVPIRPEKTIRAAADMLGSVVNQLINLEYLKSLNQKKIDVFDAEVINAVQAIKEVNKRTRELSNVASMQNILSINASIEAGRAGMAGAGFAVVAKEIGNLSRNSALVFTEIQEFVNVIGSAVNNMHKVELTEKDQEKSL